jgi:diaminopimelate decarboxylase
VTGAVGASVPWLVKKLECAGNPPPCSELLSVCREERKIDGATLLRLASAGIQVINDDFTASKAGSPQQWLTIRAVDNTYWDIVTQDLITQQKVLAEIPDAKMIK